MSYRCAIELEPYCFDPACNSANVTAPDWLANLKRDIAGLPVRRWQPGSSLTSPGIDHPLHQPRAFANSPRRLPDRLVPTCVIDRLSLIALDFVLSIIVHPEPVHAGLGATQGAQVRDVNRLALCPRAPSQRLLDRRTVSAASVL